MPKAAPSRIAPAHAAARDPPSTRAGTASPALPRVSRRRSWANPDRAQRVFVRLKSRMRKRYEDHIHLPKGMVAGPVQDVEQVHASKTASLEKLAKFVKSQAARPQREIVSLDDQHGRLPQSLAGALQNWRLKTVRIELQQERRADTSFTNQGVYSRHLHNDIISREWRRRSHAAKRIGSVEMHFPVAIAGGGEDVIHVAVRGLELAQGF